MKVKGLKNKKSFLHLSIFSLCEDFLKYRHFLCFQAGLRALFRELKQRIRRWFL